MMQNDSRSSQCLGSSAPAACITQDTVAAKRTSAVQWRAYGHGPTTRHRNLRNHEKKILCEEAMRHPSLKQQELAQWAQTAFNLARAPTQATICNILSRKFEYCAMTDPAALRGRRRRVVKFPNLDRELGQWVKQCEKSGMALTGERIAQQGRKIASSLGIPEVQWPAFSNGWLQSFQDRYNVRALKRLRPPSATPSQRTNVLPMLLPLPEQPLKENAGLENVEPVGFSLKNSMDLHNNSICIQDNSMSGHDNSINGHDNSISRHENSISIPGNSISIHENSISIHDNSISGHDNSISVEAKLEAAHVVNSILKSQSKLVGTPLEIITQRDLALCQQLVGENDDHGDDGNDEFDPASEQSATMQALKVLKPF